MEVCHPYRRARRRRLPRACSLDDSSSSSAASAAAAAALGSSAGMDGFLEALLKDGGCNSNRVSPALERILHRQSSYRDKLQILERALSLAVQLQDASNRLSREYATCHNASAWPLTQDLTIKVFSLLGVHSLCRVAATCTMFNKLAMEPACYEDVDLSTRGLRINNRIVAKIIQRAGQCLRLLKLGVPPRQNKAQVVPPKVFPVKVDGSPEKPCHTSDNSLSTKPSLYDRSMYNLRKSCLEPLTADIGAVGSMLRTLHLFNIEEMDSKHLCKAIAACPSLTDFEAIGLYVNVRSVLLSLTSHCHNLKRVCFQHPKASAANGWRTCGSDSIKTTSCNQLVQECPNISSLSLRGFKLIDPRVKILLKGLLHLREVDFSGADLLTGSFLRDFVSSGEQQIEYLILRDCVKLKEVEVERLLFALSTGECRSLRYLDVSNKDGLAAVDWFDRQRSLSGEAIARVRKERPELELLADFPDQKSSSDSESVSMISSFGDSDDTATLHPGYQTSDYMSEDTSSSSSSDTDDDDNENYEDVRFVSPYNSDGENGDIHADSDQSDADVGQNNL